MFIISYDIENDRLRNSVAKALLRAGLHRVQFSVFLGTIDKGDFPTLWAELQQITQKTGWTPTDSIMAIPIHGSQVKSIEMLGTWPDRWAEITGVQNTLFV